MAGLTIGELQNRISDFEAMMERFNGVGMTSDGKLSVKGVPAQDIEALGAAVQAAYYEMTDLLEIVDR